MRIAICDDLERDIARLLKLLDDYLETNGLVAEVDIFTSGEALLDAFAPSKYQIIFQDIYMDKTQLTGMQTAEKIRETDTEVAIILTTTSLDYGIESYRLNAAYYIVKPINKSEFAHGMERCRRQIERFAKTIEVVENRLPVKIRLRDIYYVEVIGRSCIFKTALGETKSNMVFDDLTQKMGGFPFLRCHRSFIVNLLHISDMVKKNFVVKNGVQVPISKSYQYVVEKAFREYFRDENEL